MPFKHCDHELPKARRSELNYDISLTIWDSIFGSDYIPSEVKKIKLKFPKIEESPEKIIGQKINKKIVCI